MTAIAMAVLCAAVQDGDLRPEKLKALEELRDEVRALHVLRRAEVSRHQAAKLLEAVEAHFARMSELVKQNEAKVDEALELMKRAKALLAKGEAVGEELQAELDRTRAEAEKVAGDAAASVSVLAARMRETLQERQLGMLLTYGQPIVPAAVRTFIKGTLDASRGMTDEEFGRVIGDGIERHLDNVARRVTMTAEEREDEFDRILELYDRARSLAEDEYKSRVDSIVDRLLTEGKTGESSAMASLSDKNADRWLVQMAAAPATVRALRARSKE